MWHPSPWDQSAGDAPVRWTFSLPASPSFNPDSSVFLFLFILNKTLSPSFKWLSVLILTTRSTSCLACFPLFLFFSLVCCSPSQLLLHTSVNSFSCVYATLTSPLSLHLTLFLSPYSQVGQHSGGDHFQARAWTQRKWVFQMVSSICLLSLQSVLNYETIHGR